MQINILFPVGECFYFFYMVQTITKNDVVSEIANKTGISKAQVAKTLDTLFDVLTSNTKKGNKVALTGYITLKTVSTDNVEKAVYLKNSSTFSQMYSTCSYLRP